MKKIIYSIALGVVLLTESCSDFTEIQPKGMNLLTTTEQLEMLLNNSPSISVADFQTMSGDAIFGRTNVPTLVNLPNKTRDAIMIGWDEKNMDKMAELTSNDSQYSNCYSTIGKIANPILSRIKVAEGDEATKVQLKCEALFLRAYFHYILVNKFAKAYNPATAEQDLGIPYMLEDQDLIVPAEQLSVKKVYEHILADLDEAIDLDGLPVEAINRMRISKPCVYAAKAMVLISMQQFDLAAEAARKALALSNKVDNYNEMTTTVKSRVSDKEYPVIVRTRLQCAEDLYYTHSTMSSTAISPEAWNAFEEGHACRDKMSNDVMLYDYDYTQGMGHRYLGLSDYITVGDSESGWNNGGIKTTHMYLIIAEAEIHNGNYKEAMKALDAIRVNRIDPLVYEPLEGTVSSEQEAIFHLKQTSHGENIYSCYNFINLKRWNQVEGYKKTLTRNLAGQEFTLAPDSPLWIFPFPKNAVEVNPKLKQNYKE